MSEHVLVIGEFMSHNRASDAAAFDWIATASTDELRKAETAMQARQQVLFKQSSLGSTNGVPNIYENFAFCGAARAFYRTELPADPEEDISGPPDSIVGFPVDNFQKSVKSAKPALSGLDVVNVGGMG